jgi:hypothetical protein
MDRHDGAGEGVLDWYEREIGAVARQGGKDCVERSARQKSTMLA